VILTQNELYNMIIPQLLVEKYNKAIPRYTSYPTVPHWQENPPTQSVWLHRLNQNIEEESEISLYIHLPYCENLCTYCGCNKRITKNHGVESPYIDTVLKEWQIYLENFKTTPILKELHLGGGTPTFFAPDQLERLVKTICSSIPIALEHSFSFEAHPNSTSHDHLKTLYDLGFRRISIGVQDVSPDILKAINRIQTKEQIAEVTTSARNIGYTSINYDLIYGLPFQHDKHVYDTMDFVADHMPDRIAFYSYAHVPWKSQSQRAFTDRDVPFGLAKHKLRSIGEILLTSMGYHTVGMDHFAVSTDSLYRAHAQGKMHRNFMGYTDQYTRSMIGLGSSSISDCRDTFVQNEKTVEAYTDAIAHGKLPIYNGHELSPEEIITRGYMLDLICRDQVKWEPEESLHKLIAMNKNELQDMQIDGLLELNERQLRVTKMGQKFIRNICAALDPKLSKRSEQPQFSQAI
jgi:oxygen-independent coproporphyrinogen III oxidase